MAKNRLTAQEGNHTTATLNGRRRKRKLRKERTRTTKKGLKKDSKREHNTAKHTDTEEVKEAILS